MKQNIKCDARVSSLENYWRGEVSLPANQNYILIIDYPFDKEGRFEIDTEDGMGLAEILKQIGKCYKKQYANVKKDGNGYWHAIDDLILEGFTVDHIKKVIKLSVGS